LIVPKNRDVDACLRAEPAAAPRVFEVHPELAFWRLNSARALAEPKKVKGRCHEPGLALRRRLLVAAGLPTAVVHSEPPSGAGQDDLLDALACAVMARRIQAGEARPFPDPPERDPFGLPMAIWA
jgi:predicted RNase H-like nuclease